MTIRPGETVTSHAIRLIREDEREKCAKIADDHARNWVQAEVWVRAAEAKSIADEIRGLSA